MHEGHKMSSSSQMRRITICLILLVLGITAIMPLLQKIDHKTGLDKSSMEETTKTQLYNKAGTMIQKITDSLSSEGTREKKIQKILAYYEEFYDSRTTAEGNTELDALFKARDIRGGGGTYRDLSLITCVRFIISEQTNQVVAEPIICPGRKPDQGSKEFGNFIGYTLLDKQKLNTFQPEVNKHQYNNSPDYLKNL